MFKQWVSWSRACGQALQPMWSRPRQPQVAALCYRVNRKNGLDVLLITSRETRRWIPPKGWLMDGRTGDAVAELEAWEEAGVKPKRVYWDPVGSYQYQKALEDGTQVLCEVALYPVEVSSLSKNFPESGQRDRAWFSQEEASRLVGDPGLGDLIAAFRPSSDI